MSNKFPQEDERRIQLLMIIVTITVMVMIAFAIAGIVLAVFRVPVMTSVLHYEPNETPGTFYYPDYNTRNGKWTTQEWRFANELYEGLRERLADIVSVDVIFETDLLLYFVTLSYDTCQTKLGVSYESLLRCPSISDWLDLTAERMTTAMGRTYFGRPYP